MLVFRRYPPAASALQVPLAKYGNSRQALALRLYSGLAAKGANRVCKVAFSHE
jgi:hypothetical protein